MPTKRSPERSGAEHNVELQTKRDELKKSHRWPLFTSLSASFHCLGGESFHKPANGKKVRANLNARGQGP